MQVHPCCIITTNGLQSSSMKRLVTCYFNGNGIAITYNATGFIVLAKTPYTNRLQGNFPSPFCALCLQYILLTKKSHFGDT